MYYPPQNIAIVSSRLWDHTVQYTKYNSVSLQVLAVYLMIVHLQGVDKGIFSTSWDYNYSTETCNWDEV